MLHQILTAVTVKFKVYEKFAEFQHIFANLSISSQSLSALMAWQQTELFHFLWRMTKQKNTTQPCAFT